jgi:ABC-type nitrate/sulfonate/bicarbonate transport system substrate-binding protein
MRQLLVALIVALCYEMAPAQGTNRVMSGYAAISGPHAVLWVARDAGLFEKMACARRSRTSAADRP